MMYNYILITAQRQIEDVTTRLLTITLCLSCTVPYVELELILSFSHPIIPHRLLLFYLDYY